MKLTAVLQINRHSTEDIFCQKSAEANRRSDESKKIGEQKPPSVGTVFVHGRKDDYVAFKPKLPENSMIAGIFCLRM